MQVQRTKAPYLCVTRRNTQNKVIDVYEPAFTVSRFQAREGSDLVLSQLRFQRACLEFERQHGKQAKNDYRKSAKHQKIMECLGRLDELAKQNA